MAKTAKTAPKTFTKPANVPARAAGTAAILTVAKKPEAVEDDEDAVEGTAKKSQKALMVRRVSNMIRKMRQANDFLRDSVAEDEANAALKALTDLNGSIGLLDASWARARREKLTRQTFNANQLVAVTDAWKKKYEGLIEPEEMDDLRIVKKAHMKNGNAIYSVTTGDGARLFIAAAHLRAAE